uniref:Uncharacterized protein n=1 Tax=Setaria viridis TaxID=4556 RepID=A0A4U6TK70_SETVI|nr:hypothetical protein SEVIR_9G517200v2 [Setaria viridis]
MADAAEAISERLEPDEFEIGAARSTLSIPRPSPPPQSEALPPPPRCLVGAVPGVGEARPPSTAPPTSLPPRRSLQPSESPQPLAPASAAARPVSSGSRRRIRVRRLDRLPILRCSPPPPPPPNRGSTAARLLRRLRLPAVSAVTTAGRRATPELLLQSEATGNLHPRTLTCRSSSRSCCRSSRRRCCGMR